LKDDPHPKSITSFEKENTLAEQKKRSVMYQSPLSFPVPFLADESLPILGPLKVAAELFRMETQPAF
jgi:hypothetical protein